ncbi:magnesium and cobalt transport protein CorA [Desulfosarcina widdelii]|uniref:Magnesium transport protein CorA n=1 Tax=Desulfosarcina widdelii TaxID=947919 RepID=A0A5K7Z2K0_9BACT|nr:magnesium/cobalt transporter CorA [Desulfosarcina widdelii]BBO75926.1 magnesium and cobalt transport protein CorA [Desulfosarcina widdelii]
MSRFTHRALKKVGSSPGTLVHVGERKLDKVRLSVMHYTADSLTERTIDEVEEGLDLVKEGTTTWLNIDGTHDVALMENIGRRQGIHPLTLEDVLNTTQRPKSEVFDDYLFVVLKMLRYDTDEESIASEQISLILGENILISFQEAAGDVFEPVRERIRKGKGRIRGFGCDYLTYALIDAIVDHYFVILDHVGRRLEQLEEGIDNHPDAGLLDEIHAVRRELIYLRKQVWPLRDIISLLLKEESSFFSDTTRLFIRDVYDHTIQTIDTIESFRDILSGLQDLYLSIISNRMNEVMKVLTVIATIFIPVTFIAGIYGMNFTHMPELEWRWGYPLFWIVVVAVVVGMIFFFRKKRWL